MYLLIAIFLGLYVFGRMGLEKSKSKAYDLRREREREFADKFCFDEWEDVTQFVECGNYFNDICETFAEDFEYIFGKDWQNEISIEPNTSGLHLHKPHLHYVTSLIMAARGKISHDWMFNPGARNGFHSDLSRTEYGDEIGVCFIQCIACRLKQSDVSEDDVQFVFDDVSRMAKVRQIHGAGSGMSEITLKPVDVSALNEDLITERRRYIETNILTQYAPEDEYDKAKEFFTDDNLDVILNELSEDVIYIYGEQFGQGDDRWNALKSSIDYRWLYILYLSNAIGRIPIMSFDVGKKKGETDEDVQIRLRTVERIEQHLHEHGNDDIYFSLVLDTVVNRTAHIDDYKNRYRVRKENDFSAGATVTIEDCSKYLTARLPYNKDKVQIRAYKQPLGNEQIFVSLPEEKPEQPEKNLVVGKDVSENNEDSFHWNDNIPGIIALTLLIAFVLFSIAFSI